MMDPLNEDEGGYTHVSSATTHAEKASGRTPAGYQAQGLAVLDEAVALNRKGALGRWRRPWPGAVRSLWIEYSQHNQGHHAQHKKKKV